MHIRSHRRRPRGGNGGSDPQFSLLEDQDPPRDAAALQRFGKRISVTRDEMKKKLWLVKSRVNERRKI